MIADRGEHARPRSTGVATRRPPRRRLTRRDDAREPIATRQAAGVDRPQRDRRPHNLDREEPMPMTQTRNVARARAALNDARNAIAAASTRTRQTRDGQLGDVMVGLAAIDESLVAAWDALAYVDAELGAGD